MVDVEFTFAFNVISGKVRSKTEHLYSDDKIKLLKFAAIYGANASGKSNLISAIDFVKETIIKGFRAYYKIL